MNTYCFEKFLLLTSDSEFVYSVFESVYPGFESVFSDSESVYPDFEYVYLDLWPDNYSSL